MDESEWLASMNAEKMFQCLHGKISDRKFRLFTCASCRDMAARTMADVLDAVTVAERYADGALKPGGVAYFDTMNVQGTCRDELESALAQGGFYMPLLELNRQYRQALRATGIPHAFVLGNPILLQHDEHGRPVPRWGDDRRRAEAEATLRETAAEFEKRMTEAADAEREGMGPQVKTAVVIYSTG